MRGVGTQGSYCLPPITWMAKVERAWVLIVFTLLVAWWCMGVGDGTSLWVRVSLSLGVFAICTIACRSARHQVAQGVLHWDTGTWVLERANGVSSLLHSVSVVVDAQQFLLLAFYDTMNHRTYLLVQNNGVTPHWRALRRAVYSPVQPAQKLPSPEASKAG